jgi:hypothetical protein
MSTTRRSFRRVIVRSIREIDVLQRIENELEAARVEQTSDGSAFVPVSHLANHLEYESDLRDRVHPFMTTKLALRSPSPSHRRTRGQVEGAPGTLPTADKNDDQGKRPSGLSSGAMVGWPR